MLYKVVRVKIGSDTLGLELYNNDAAKALYAKLQEADVTFTADDYGNFEKVCELGFNLPASDENITVKPQDVMLYQGDKLVFIYGENKCDYTPIGYLTSYSTRSLKT